VIGDRLQVIYFVFDGAFGPNDALQMVRQVGLHLIAKLRYDAALFSPMMARMQDVGSVKSMGESSSITIVMRSICKHLLEKKISRQRSIRWHYGIRHLPIYSMLW
jgi:hypothetical protein